MTEELIFQAYLTSPQNANARRDTVNALRHIAMDLIAFDVKDDAAYWAVYEDIMTRISSQFPLLSWEVKRQMAKKSRRQVRRALEERQASVHI